MAVLLIQEKKTDSLKYNWRFLFTEKCFLFTEDFTGDWIGNPSSNNLHTWPHYFAWKCLTLQSNIFTQKYQNIISLNLNLLLSEKIALEVNSLAIYLSTCIENFIK